MGAVCNLMIKSSFVGCDRWRKEHSNQVCKLNDIRMFHWFLQLMVLHWNSAHDEVKKKRAKSMKFLAESLLNGCAHARVHFFPVGLCVFLKECNLEKCSKVTKSLVLLVLGCNGKSFLMHTFLKFCCFLRI